MLTGVAIRRFLALILSIFIYNLVQKGDNIQKKISQNNNFALLLSFLWSLFEFVHSPKRLFVVSRVLETTDVVRIGE
jgi:membrane associated rhomboid family serine protease